MRAILTYHSIDASGSPISCHPDTFTRHVKWLTSGRISVVTLDALMALPADASAVAITFDDGFENFQDKAAPLLLEHGLPATLFVVADRVGQRNIWDDAPRRRTPDLPLLDWPALGRLQEQGVTIGAHSLSHRRLTELSPDELHEEVTGCADRLESRTGRRPRAFAYPYGTFNRQVAAAVEGAYQWGCTTEFRTLGRRAHRTALPRLDMTYFRDTDRLEEWGSRRFSVRVALRHRLRQLRSAALADPVGRFSASHGRT